MKIINLIGILLILIGLQNHLIAQSTEAAEESLSMSYHHELGLNVTQMLANVLNLANTAVVIDPYLISYKLVGRSGKTAFRSALGFSYTKSGTESSPSDQNISRNIINLRVGIEKRIPLSQNWIFYYGGDLLCDTKQDQSVTISDIDRVEIKNNFTAGGIGVVLGSQINLGKRVALGTEAGYSGRVGFGKRQETFVSFPSQNKTNKWNSYSLTGNAPTSLYIIIKL